MEVYIIRHGQSTNNALADHRDRVCDPLLTALGVRQAQVLAHHLADGTRLVPWERVLREGAGYGITRLYCSPMWRSLQTAWPIGEALGLAPEVWIEIHEHGGIFLDHGEEGGIVGYPGKTRSEILATFPNYLLPQGITEQGWWHYPGQEDRAACDARAIRAAETLRAWATSDERIALVSHGDFMNALLKALFTQLPDRGVTYHHRNTSISWLSFSGNGRLDVQYLNRVEHLPQELVS